LAAITDDYGHFAACAPIDTESPLAKR